jgi:hypothetical protein
LKDSGFQSWLASQDSSCFTCYGIPGCGITVISASLTAELSPNLSDPEFAICYYYCDYSVATTFEYTTVIGTLIRQLLEKVEIPEYIENQILRSFDGIPTSPSLHDMLDLLEASLKLFTTCLVVIDGIDELPRESQFTMVGAIKSLMGVEKTLVKILVSCRCEENDIRRALRGPSFFSIEISPENISNDIRLYINDEVDKRLSEGRLVLGNPCIKDEIIQSLIAGAKDV